MDQKPTPTPDPDLSDPQQPFIYQDRVPPLDSRRRDLPNVREVDFPRARIVLFISLPILILLFNSNTIVISIITTMLILLSIGSMFDPVSNSILRYVDNVVNLLGKPFGWLWHFLFITHLSLVGSWFKRRRRLVIDITAISIIVILLGTTTLSPFVTMAGSTISDDLCLHGWLWFSCNSGVGVYALPDLDGVRVGLIADDTYGPFDKSILNQDESNVEKFIFGENKQACKKQHITLAVVAMLSRTVEDPLSSAKSGLQNVQGSYLAQHAYNATNPAVSICLVIVNLGTANTATSESPLVKSHPGDYSLPRLIHQIAQFAHNDPSFRGIVGFPYSQQAKEAINLIKDYQDLSNIPIISPTASSDELSNVPNFYRIVSPDHSQGTALAQFFCKRLKQDQTSDVIAMLRDNSNAYSRSLQLAFADAVNCGDPTHRMTIPYTNGDASSIEKATDQALTQHARYILFPGYDQDMDTVEQEVHRVLQDRASDVVIIGGDGINNVEATTHYSYSRVYASDFTAPLPLDDPIAVSFLQHGFPKSLQANAIPFKLWIPGGTLLAYDAVSVFAQTTKNVQVKDLTQENFNSVLENISFRGASGEITFQGNRNNKHGSDRDQGNVYITCTDFAHNIHLVAEYTTVNTSDGAVLPLSQTDSADAC